MVVELELETRNDECRNWYSCCNIRRGGEEAVKYTALSGLLLT